MASNKRSNTSNTVIKTAIINGIWKSRFSAIAAPITSAISVAMIAISVSNHKIIPRVRLVRARIACARSIWVTIPNLAAMYCKSIAIKLDSKIIDISKYWKFCPPVIDVAQLPGSM